MNDALYLEAERTLLGALLIDSDCAAEIFQAVRADDFLHSDHRAIFETALALFSDGLSIAPVTVAGRMGGDDTLRLCQQIALVTPTSAVWPEYAAILREGAALAKAKDSLDKMQLALRHGDDRKALLAQAEALVGVLSENDGANRRRTASQMAQRFLSRPTGVRTFLDWGFDKLNQHIFAEGREYIVLAARPSVGKTAFAWQIASYIARMRRITLFSYETDEDQTADRLMTEQSGVDYADIQHWNVNQEQMTTLVRAAQKFGKSKLDFVDAVGMTVEDIRAYVVRYRPEVVVIDYIGLIEHPDRRLSEYDRVTDVSRKLAMLFRQQGVIGIVLSQLSRLGGNRDVPQLTDLRSSGQIEQDADVVAFLYRPTDIKDGDPDRFRTLFIAKNRRGVCGEIDFLFDGAHQHFTQLDTDWHAIEVDGQPTAIKMDRKRAAQEQDPNTWQDVSLDQIPFPEFRQGGKHVQNRT